MEKQNFDTAAFFNAIASRYDRAYAVTREESRKRMRRVLEEISALGASLDILDLGVGTGRELSDLQDAGHRIVGIDISDRMIASCERRARPIRIVQGDIWSELAIVNETFDVALALHGTLAHAPNDAASHSFARTLDRVLRRQSIFIAEVPSRAWIEHIGPIGARVRHNEGIIERTGANVCVYADAATGACVEARAYDAQWWTAVFPPRFRVEVRLAGDELFVIARTSLAML